MKSTNIIDYSGVTKRYNSWPRGNKVLALDGFSLQIEQGEVFGFLGPNGAGKSTALKILLNFVYPSAGTASLLGRSVSDSRSRSVVGYLPENPYFYDYLTAEEILWFGGKASGLPKHKIHERSQMLLHRMGLLSASKRPLRTYSKGMVQRAGLALSLIHDPEVVVLDEPMSGLDPIGRKLVGDLILELKSRGKTVFFSSHILTDIERFCDRAGIIVGGRLRLVGRLSDLLSGEGTLENVFMKEMQTSGGGESL
jgi:ABC-2 type transport system ATP-binding protein